MGRRFVDVDRLATLTGEPVRSEYRMPDEPNELARHAAFAANVEPTASTRRLDTGKRGGSCRRAVRQVTGRRGTM
jgi:hypothetical protein